MKTKGLEVVFMGDEGYAFKAEKKALKSLLGTFLGEFITVVQEEVILNSVILEDNKERIGYYAAIKVVATDKENGTFSIYYCHTIH